jgi:hypothetical protein
VPFAAHNGILLGALFLLLAVNFLGQLVVLKVWQKEM